MADIKICDRCGKKIETKVWPVVVDFYRSILGMEDKDYTYTYDLCKDCTAELFKFVHENVDEKE